jgi:thiol-disulfide isomerase/thioredoxin
MKYIHLIFCLLVASFGQVQLYANEADPSPLEQRKLDGKWLFESALLRQQDRLDQVWSSVISISSDSFTISNFLDPSKELKGKIRFDEKEKEHLDIELEELDFSSIGEPVKIEAATLKGIMKLESEDAMTIAMNIVSSDERPTKWESTDSVLLLRLRRSPKGFKEYPKEITITVETADGKPVEGAIAARFQSKRSVGNQADATRQYFQEKRTDAAGEVAFPYQQLPRLFIDEALQQIAFPKLSPPSLVDGKLKVTLAPQCHVRGSIVCEELSKANQPIGWTNVYLEANGETVADCSSENGEFDFLVAAGDYKLQAYGGQLGRRVVKLSVEPNQTEQVVEPIALKALGFALLRGKPAPEFVDVAGWSGEPVKLSGLKGKYVLIDFWGYWCGPCVEAMPILFELHEKFSDKGLAIVGVHVDAEGEVDTNEKLSEKTKLFVSGIWQGKELPFSSALVSGKVVGGGENRRIAGTPGIYGIESFPTTILIDPSGNIVDKFSFRDLKHATERIEQLLQKPIE